MPRVVIIQEHFPHYRQMFFELLYEKLVRKGIELNLVYSPRASATLLSGNLPWATPIPVTRWGVVFWQNILPITRGANLVIVQQESKYAANYLLGLESVFSNQKFAYWGHGKNFQGHNASILGERIKIIASQFCDWWFAYNDLSAEVVGKLGFPQERITAVQNSIDMESISKAKKEVTPEQLESIKNKLGIRTENVAVFTGGLYPEKRLAFLIEACHLIRKKVPDFELIIIGKGPDAVYVKEEAQANPWIHFVGPKNDVEKVPYWMISKLLLMPGLVGLVVLDSFVLGVPMVTTDYPYHSPEVSYLDNGVNGIIVAPWEDVAKYANRVVQLLENPEEITTLKANALSAAGSHSVQGMVENFTLGIEKALAKPKISRLKCFTNLFHKDQPQDMKLAVIIRSLAPYLCNFYDSLALHSKKHDLRVFVGQRGTNWVNPWDSALMSLHQADHLFVNGKIFSSGRKTILPSMDLFRGLEFYRPTITLIYEYSPFSIFAMVWASLNRRPWVIATDMGPDYRAPYPKLSIFQKVTHFLGNRFCHGILALTPSAVKAASKIGKPYLLCPHSIDTDLYKPPAERKPDGPVKIITVGNFISRKGYDLLFKALGSLEGSVREEWTLLCYGAGSSAELAAQAAKEGIEGKVYFSKFVAVDELIKAYQEADIFVLPTRSDTYAVVVHEAAACGLPLIVSQYAGAADILVEEGKNGHVIDPEQTGQLAERLKELINNPQKRSSYGLASRLLAEYWDVKHNARRAIDWLGNMQLRSS